MYIYTNFRPLNAYIHIFIHFSQLIQKIVSALSIPLSTLFENIGNPTEENNISHLCYELLISKSKDEQEALYKIFLEFDKYKKTKI